MMTKQRKTLDKELKKLDEVVKKIQKIVFDLLSTEAKDLDICIGDECFKFYVGTTPEEEEEIKFNKCKLITLMLRDAFDMYFDEKPDEVVWKNVYALTVGSDPKDYKFNKKSKETLCAPREDGVTTESGHTAIPMNENNYQVIIQTGNKDRLYEKFNTGIKADHSDNSFDKSFQNYLKDRHREPTAKEILAMDFSDESKIKEQLLKLNEKESIEAEQAQQEIKYLKDKLNDMEAELVNYQEQDEI